MVLRIQGLLSGLVPVEGAPNLSVAPRLHGILHKGRCEGNDNPPDPTPGWESRFFFARLLSERDIWGVPERWVEPLPNPIFRSYARLSASQRGPLMYFRGTALHWFSSREEFFHWYELICFIVMEKGKKRAPKRACLLEEGNILRASNHCIEGMVPDLRSWLNIFKALRTVAEWNLSAPIIPKIGIAYGGSARYS
ncbi:hypothetical protein ACLOJK_006475 [Asimina triloba]